MTHNMALCAIPLPHCHTDSFAVPGDRATARGAAIIEPACRHPSRQLRRSAGFKSMVGASFPRPPSIPCAFDPSIPKGRRWGVIGSRVGQTLRHFNRRSGLASSVKIRAISVA